MGFSNSIIPQSLSSERALKHPHPITPVKRLLQPQQVKTMNACYGRQMKKFIERNSWNLFAIPPTDPIFNTNSHSPAHTITLFYSAINDRNLKHIKKLIAEDCVFEDYTFTKPFQGREEVLSFLEKLVSCMGENMEFNIEHICEGNNHTATVNWHIDWNKLPVPLTKGCSSYTFSLDGDELEIEKAQILVEPPVKLGVAALTAFKIVSVLFDAFPPATKWFLSSRHVLFHLLVKASSIAIKSVTRRLLAWHMKLLNVAASILSLALTLKVLFYLAKFLN